MRLHPVEARGRFGAARVARLATMGPDGAPHLVPVVFAVAGDDIWTAVDAKPKRSRELRRVENIAANPAVSLLVDHYEDDWSKLWWVRADGVAEIAGDWPDAEDGLLLLCEKYEQYQQEPPDGPVLHIRVHHWSGWAAS
ncbi:PPOX class F420-dependent oxidoreductase [Longimycelium tulufanense]|uniref:PPOX class F420-dependent oxidoreductase n=1 Tax=Longimycelium tulufanense TaxID=907463 RepID=A0A8J3FT16_9PSEU|nr:TIGR03668 family PPOX class F420-dependent oxidoreductase [Longimycelium tulufanense]GGM44961.1 PPOX class F420-dependent oxidoreductase [Longimycelium tulufanense]